MATNDTVLIDGVIDDILKSQGAVVNSDSIGKTFEFFAVQQILKNYALNDEDIELCRTDGKADSGFDYILLLVDGQLVKDAEVFHFPKKNTEMEIYVITSKHADSFKAQPLESISSGVDDFFDFTKSRTDLDTNLLNEKVLDARDDIIIAYKKLALANCKTTIKFVFVSRGDSADIGDVTKATGDCIVRKVEQKFSDTKVSLTYIGSKELVQLYRDNSVAEKELTFEDSFSHGNSYIMLVKLSNYYDFIKHSDGSIDRRLFNANVRDYMGMNRVNEDILSSLNSEKDIDFWYMNNGVTIIASRANTVSKTIYLTEPQIVNGLQTSESICTYFRENGEADDRNVLVKVFVTQDDEVSGKIIKATNNQTPVELVSLFATEKYQCDIEQYLLRYDMYYDRKCNYYKNKGIEPSKIVSVSYLAMGFISVIMKNPKVASTLKQKKIKSWYNEIFNEKYSLAIWPVIVKIQKRMEHFLCGKRKKDGSEGFLKSWRAIFSFLATSVVLKDFAYSEKRLIELSDNMDLFTDDILEDIYSEFVQSFGKQVFERKWCSKLKINNIAAALGKKYSIAHIQSICQNMLRLNRPSVDDAFISRVKELLPPQPWPVGTHTQIAKKLGCYPSAVSDVIDYLIDIGEVYKQINGVLYDEDDNVVNPVRETMTEGKNTVFFTSTSQIEPGTKA